MKTFKVMICYVTKDVDLAKTITKKIDGMVIKELDAKIETVYMDKPGSGCTNDWDKWSFNSILSSDIVLQIWTKNTMSPTIALNDQKINNRFIKNELLIAINNAKPIIIADFIGINGYDESFNLLTYNIHKDYFRSPKDVSKKRFSDILQRNIRLLNDNIAPSYCKPQRVFYSSDGMGTLGDYFIGRKDTIQQIDELFRNGKSIVVLTGDGGIGKTEIARKYISEKGSKNMFCYKYCADEKSLAQIILSLSYEQELSEQQNKLDDDQKACIRLEQMQMMDPRYILLLDNFNGDFDAPQNRNIINKISEIVPFHILFSSRTTSTNSSVGVITINPLSLEEQKELFYLRSGLAKTSETDTEIEKLSNTISGHTMTIELVARLIGAKKGFSIKDLNNSLLQNKSLVSSEHTSNNMTILAHLKKLFDITSLTSIQKDVLYCLCFFCQLGISYPETKKIIAKVHDCDPESAIDQLILIGHIKRKTTGNLYTHPLVGEIAFLEYAEGRERIRDEVVHYFIYKYGGDPRSESVKDFERWISYLSYALPKFPINQYGSTGPLYGHLGDLYLKLGRYKMALDCYNKAFEIANQQVENEAFISFIDTFDAKHHLGKALMRLGDLYSAFSGNVYKAKEYYKRAINVYKEIIDTDQKINNRTKDGGYNDYAVVLGRMGALLYDEKDYDNAKYYCQEYNSIMEIVYSHSENNGRYKMNLASSYGRLGLIDLALDNTDIALSHFKKEYAHTILFATNNAIASLHIGNVFEKEGNLREAEQHYLAFYDTFKRLVQEKGVILENIKNLRIACGLLGSLYKQLNINDKAILYYEERCELLDKHVSLIDTADSKVDSYYGHKDLADLYENNGDFINALKHLKKSYAIGELLIQFFEEKADTFCLNISKKIIELSQKNNNYSDAQKYSISESNLLQRRVAQNPDTQKELELSNSYFSIAEISKLLKDDENTLYYFQACFDIREKIIQSKKTNQSINSYFEVCEAFGKYYIDRGDIKNAFRFLKYIPEQFTAYHYPNKTFQDLYSSAHAYHQIFCYLQKENKKEAKIYQRKHVSLMNEIIRSYSEKELHPEIVTSIIHAHLYQIKYLHLKKNLKHTLEAIGLSYQLKKQHPEYEYVYSQTKDAILPNLPIKQASIDLVLENFIKKYNRKHHIDK